MNVFIGIPCYDGKMVSDCALSLIKNIRCLENLGHSVVVSDFTGCCYIASARNALVKKFLDSHCNVMIFVDNDLGFDDDAMLRLIESEEDVCIGAYPYRNNSMGYPIKVVDDPNYSTSTPLVKVINDRHYIELTSGPTGLMMISRLVFEQMKAGHPEWKYITTHGELYSFFDTGHLFEENLWYGEDVTFCKRWREMGGHIYCFPNITFQHHGMMNASGNLFNYYMNLKGAEGNENETDKEKLNRLMVSINSRSEQLSGVKI